MGIRAATHFWAYVACAAMLAVAALPLPRWYYPSFKIAIFAGVGYLIYRRIEARQRLSAWTVFLVALALVFNPFIPIRLPLNAWIAVDVVGAAALAIHAWILRLDTQRTGRGRLDVAVLGERETGNLHGPKP